MERCSYGFYTKRSEILDNLQKKKEQEKDSPQSPGFQQQLVKPGDKQLLGSSEIQNVNVPVSQHVAPQLLSPPHGAGTPLQKEDPKDKTLKVTNSTTITLIENGNLNGEKDKDNNYPKNYFTLEPKNDKKDETNKNSITITRTIPKQSPSGILIEKPKGPPKPAKRPLQCLETLAEKAGITFEDKYEAANTLLALDKQNNSFRRPDIKATKSETENQTDEYRYRSQKEEDDKLQIQQQIIQQQQQQQFQQLQHQQLQQLQQQHLHQLQQQALQRQHQAIQQHIKNQQDQQELLQKQYQQQQQHQQQQQQHQQQQHQQQQQQQQQQHQQQQQQQHQQQQQQQQHQQQQQQQQQQHQSQQQQQQTQQHQQQQQQQQQHQKPEIQQLPQQQDIQQKFVQVVNNQPVHTQQFNVPGIGEINLSFLASPQSNVNLLFDKNQKASLNTEIKSQQQIVDNQNQVQQQISMSQHESTQQHHQTVTVVSSMPSTLTQHQVQQQGTAGGIQQQAGAGITTMPSLQTLPPNTQHPPQISADWGHGRVQVIQQPIQNNTYLQQLYNAQGPLLMPGNIALHPGINSQQIQVIAAGKPFQGNQLAPHMLTQGKQVLQGQAAPFPGYTTIPAIPTTQNQTFVFSPLGVINSQPNILPAHSQSSGSGIGQQQKPQEMHKVISGGKVTAAKVAAAGQTVPVQAQCVQVSQPVLGQQPQAQIISPLQTGGQTMQFAPWQISGALPQVWATGGLQASTIPTGGLLAPNPIFIRGTQPDATPSMFIQHSPQNNVQHANVSVAPATTTTSKSRASDNVAKAPRPLTNILPSTSIRPASSVSTQTNANAQNQKQRGKVGVRSPAPTTKQDAANQTNKVQIQQPKQQLLLMNTNGQMAQITSVQEKQPIPKNPQQSLMQQQQQRQTQEQLVQHNSVPSTNYIPTGYLATLGIGAPLTPTISMVHTPTLVGGNLVQTTVAMAVQPPTLTHTAPMQTVAANTLNSPPLTIQTQGTMGVITAQPSTVLPLQTVSQVKPDEEKPQPAKISMTQLPSLDIELLCGPDSPPMPAVITTADAIISTTTSNVESPTPPEPSKSTPSKSDSAIFALDTTITIVTTAATTSRSVSSPPPSTSSPPTTSAPPSTSSASHTSPSSSQVVTTVASSTSTSSTITSAITTPVSSGVTMFKSSHGSHRLERHIGQQATHDKGLPKAMVKPNILTHVIEGYVIQEAGEPFAVNRPLREWAADKEQDKENKLPATEEPPRKKPNLDSGTSTRISSSNESSAVAAPAPSPAKPEIPAAESMDTAAEEPQPAKIPNAQKWSVSEVCDFIRNIPGCAGYADEFLIQEVDGEALLLIRPEHLVMALSMKLGPALKIVACIDTLRPEGEKIVVEFD